MRVQTLNLLTTIIDIMRNNNGKLKVVVLTNKDRKLLEGIHRSLKDIRRGKIKPFLAEELKRHK